MYQVESYSIQLVLAIFPTIPVIFVAIPTNYQVEEDTFAIYLETLNFDSESVNLDQPNQMIAASFRNFGLEIIDPLPEFRRLYSEEGYVLYGKIDNHLNALGYKTLAQYVYPQVEKKLKENFLLDNVNAKKKSLQNKAETSGSFNNQF